MRRSTSPPTKKTSRAGKEPAASPERLGPAAAHTCQHKVAVWRPRGRARLCRPLPKLYRIRGPIWLRRIGQVAITLPVMVAGPGDREWQNVFVTTPRDEVEVSVT